nr:cellulose synthase-like protein G2 [Ipomoea batatas]
MHSNDPSSARQAMCFHLDPTISSSLAFVQFPQKFHNLSNNDIYTSALSSIFDVKWRGMDGLRGPILSGTCFYIKRKALYGMSITPKETDVDITKLRDSFGPSYEFTSSVTRSSMNGNADMVNSLLKETKSVASCAYEKDTQWGKDIGFMYNSVVEDYSTGFWLHCKGWSSVLCNPARAAFLGSTTTSLNDTLVQGTRWNSGLLDCLLSRFCPLIYGLPRMPLLQCFCYTYLAAQPLYFLPAWCLAIVPQLCLLNNLPIYPKVSNSMVHDIRFRLHLSPSKVLVGCCDHRRNNPDMVERVANVDDKVHNSLFLWQPRRSYEADWYQESQLHTNQQSCG